MKIALLHSTNPSRKAAVNKDLNGGLGTADEYGRSLGGRLLTFLKRKYVCLPVVSIAHIQAILKRQGHAVEYFEDRLPCEPFDVALLLGSLVDLQNENRIAAETKRRFPNSRVGVFGPFPARFPGQYPATDFVIGGEAEAFFLECGAERMLCEDGLIRNDATLDLNDLPAPDYSGFPIERYSYAPMLPRRPYLPLLASKGCPYSCRFYCSYGEYQGPRIRQRRAELVYADLRYVARAYGARSVQFRDPLFGMDRSWVLDFCQLLIERPLDVEWGMETRADLLTPELLERMHAAGLRSVNLGVETGDARIAKANRRKLVDDDHQTMILEHAKRIGVRINAFFMLGLEGDTPESMRATADFALAADPTAARFSVSTPYPGTGFYEQLARENRLNGAPLEQHNQFTLVHKHPNLTPLQVERALVRAYLRFYLRPTYIAKTAFGVWRSNSRLFADNRRRAPDATAVPATIGPAGGVRTASAADIATGSSGLFRKMEEYFGRLSGQLRQVEMTLMQADARQLDQFVRHLEQRSAIEPAKNRATPGTFKNGAASRPVRVGLPMLDRNGEDAEQSLRTMRTEVAQLTRQVRLFAEHHADAAQTAHSVS